MDEFDLIIKQDEEDIEAAEVFVDATVGTNKYRFLLDTGAARTCVALDDYTATFSHVGTSNSSGVFASSSDDLVMSPSIELGPIRRENFTVNRRSAKGPVSNNIIGMDMLKDVCCHFLFDENRVLVDPHSASGACDTFQELFYDDTFHPYIDVQFREVKAKAVWDTGAGITVVDISFIKQYPALFEEVGRSHGTDSTGFKMETPMFVMEGTTIGNHEFPRHKVAGVDLSQVNSTIKMPMNLILGYSTLSKANWLFDFPGRKWAITGLLSV